MKGSESREEAKESFENLTFDLRSLAPDLGYPKSRARTTHFLLTCNLRRFSFAVPDSTDGGQNAVTSFWRVPCCLDCGDALLPSCAPRRIRVCSLFEPETWTCEAEISANRLSPLGSAYVARL